MSNNLSNTVLVKIKALIKKNGITNTSLSKRINIPSQTLYNILNRKQRLTVETLVSIAKVFNVSISSFFNETTEDCSFFKKNYYFLNKYKNLKSMPSEINNYHNLYDYIHDILIDEKKYRNLRSLENYDMNLESVFFTELFNIYEIQELFIKGYYTEEIEGDTPEYKKWLEYEKKIKVKGHKDARYKELMPLIIIEVRKGYEKYFSRQIM